MRTPTRIILSLIFALPIAVFPCVILYLLITQYDYFFPGMAGAVLVLMELVLAPYALALIFMNYRQLKKDGWKKTLFENVHKPMLRYLPAILGMGLLIYVWLYATQYSMRLAVPGFAPNGITFLLAFLLFVREVLEVPHRFYMINKAIEEPAHAGMEDLFTIKLSVKQQKFWAVVQSVVASLITWAGMLISGFLLQSLLKEWVSQEIMVFFYLIAWILWFVWIQKTELKLEKQYREQHYIPWKAQYK